MVVGVAAPAIDHRLSTDTWDTVRTARQLIGAEKTWGAREALTWHVEERLHAALPLAIVAIEIALALRVGVANPAVAFFHLASTGGCRLHNPAVEVSLAIVLAGIAHYVHA
jgi:hypothetical protein